MPPEFYTPVAIVVMAIFLSIVIERGLDKIAASVGRNTEQAKRAADKLDGTNTKLDALWGPLKGINDVLWQKSGIDPNYD